MEGLAMKRSRLLGAICACVFTVSFTGTATAAVLVPADLLPGDTYQLAFVTSTLTTAASDQITFYNTFVQGVANSAGIGDSQGITWTAIGSTSDVDARNNAPVFSESTPVYNMIGERVADGFSDVWDGRLAKPINYTEYGDRFTRTVWTGTTQDGTAARLNGSTVYLGSPSVAHGNSDRFDSAWVYDASFQLNNTLNSLYALSSPITVIPIPPAVWLFGSGLLGLIGIARRRKVA